MDYLIRPVKADEWKRLKELRLAALADPVASVAFEETFQDAAAYPDEVWQGRADRSDAGRGALTFVGEAEDGSWGGMVAVYLEEDCTKAPEVRVAGAYVRPEHRGTGLSRELFRAAISWAWGLAEPAVGCVRLRVREDNARAVALYRSLGFVECAGSEAGERGVPRGEMEMTLTRGV
ncbi:GNAT family N-acetyltransferase [Streptomyces sp. NPDC003077]|uniref:GNAT family N-acetyltransferase n=1 Tax=Streptomyces sp. NPDC003077 TaxID=3154443 RepID=UPI0033B05CFF